MSAGARRLPLSPKIIRQAAARGWTEPLIDEAILSSFAVQTVNKATGNPATRYVHPSTKQSVVVDDLTGEVIHVGGADFLYSDGEE